MEAQAAGRPVVVAHYASAGEALCDGRTGRLVRERSGKHLADAVLDVLDNPAWTARASTEGPSFVASRFGIDRMVDETLDIYGLPAHASR
jgi:glycosyltransferase involved in cell wall biosynthesis